MRPYILHGTAALLICLALVGGRSLHAQTEQPQAAPGEQPAAAEGSSSLADRQAQLAEKYRRLEDLIFKMADFEATSNPRRAALLKQAYKQSKDRLTHSQLAAIVTLLSEQRYKRAIDGQETAQKDLEALLKLLMSEDRADRLKSESDKIKEYIKELKRLERIQRGLRGRTEAARDPRDLAQDQQRVADRTGDLADQLESDAADPKQQDENAQQQSPAGEGSAEQTPAPEGEQQEGEGQEGEQEEGSDPQERSEQPPSDDQEKPEPAPAEEDQNGSPSNSPPQEGEQQGGEPSEGQNGESPQQEGQPSPPQPGPSQEPPQGDSPPPGAQDQQQPPPNETPAEKQVREAEQKMREARERLEEAKRSESIEKQTEALEKLQEAITKLEEVLRQMREEEMERVLALLEGRFRKMLEMELKVYEGTLRLAKIPLDQRGRTIEIRASKLAFDQRKIVAEADRALTLLQEEGSSIAFPEVVQQARDDMEEVAARLDQLKVDTLTQGLEEEIISTLEELIAALQKAQQDLEEGQQPPPGEPGSGSEPPLVDVLAELKMIRSLQLRVNARTQRYARLLEDPEDLIGQALEDDLRQALDKLSELESRVHRVTRDIALGKNR